MDQNIRRQTEVVSQELHRTVESVAQRLDNASRILSDVGREVGQVREVGQQIRAFQEMLRGPKFRGTVGEEILKSLIQEVLPRDTYEFQHRFSTGVVVDAVIKTGSGMIPVDSKFPLDSFGHYATAHDQTARDAAWRQFCQIFRRHIDAVTSKYIRPSEGTMTFALLYVPSEAVYHEIISRDSELVRYARERKVFLVSPNAFYYFLQAILLGFQSQRIEQAARQVVDALEAIRKEAEQMGIALTTLETHLNNARTSLERVRIRHEALSRQLATLALPTGLAEGEKALPES